MMPQLSIDCILVKYMIANMLQVHNRIFWLLLKKELHFKIFLYMAGVALKTSAPPFEKMSGE